MNATKVKDPIKQEYNAFWEQVGKLVVQYGGKWAEIFESYGFQIYERGDNHFKMQYADRKFDVSFFPTYYQGIVIEEIDYRFTMNVMKRKKIYSLNGTIRFMRENGVGN